MKKRCPKCGGKLDWCPSGHHLCMHCGWQTQECNHPHRKLYMFNLDDHQLKNNIHEILHRLRILEENLDSMLYTLENHTDVQRLNDRIHQMVRDGYNVEVILRKKERF